MLRFLRPLAALAALAGLAAYATIMLRGPQGIRTLEDKHRQIRALEEKNATLQHEIDEKKQRIERLKNDPSTQRMEIQKRLGKIAPGATEFKIPGQRIPPEGVASTTTPEAK